MAWFMIAGMNHQWAATIERLAELDRSQAFAELDVALKALPDDVPDVHRAAVAHWRGKVALLDNAIAEAIPELALAASLETERAANHYLLGAALVRQQQWLDARTCLKRALELLLGLESARLELATVLLATGDLPQALSFLQPLQHGYNPSLLAKRAQIDVQLSEYGSAPAQIAAIALQGAGRLPESLLREWLQITGGLLLDLKFTAARAWLQAPHHVHS